MSKPNSTPNALATTEDFEFAALSEADNYRQALIESFSAHLRGAVLEVGAGIGQISTEIKRRPEVTELIAVEPHDAFAQRLAQVLPESQIVRGTAHDVPNKPWNCIVSINVLEHIEADAAELKLYHDLLQDAEGTLCLFVPARQEIYAPIDKDFGHFRRYSKNALKAKLTQAGFEIVQLRYFNLVGYFAWWLSFCVLRQRGFTVNAVRFYDRLVFPVIYWLEKTLCAPPFGQSLLVVARAKPKS